jgi:hypothetical protein
VAQWALPDGPPSGRWMTLGPVSSRAAVERQTPSATGDEYAVHLQIDVRWNAGAPMPHVFSSEGKAFVLFYTDILRGDAKARFRDDAGGDVGVPALAAAEFIRMRAIKFGGPNDETLSGHPLFGKGLEYYSAHDVINSSPGTSRA